MAFWLFLISVLCHAASKSEPKAILLSPSATSIERLAADEVQKYIYLRTKKRLPVLPSKSGKSKTATPAFLRFIPAFTRILPH